jgi:hypothetical protein
MPQYSGIWTLGQAAQAIKNQDWAGVPPTVVEYLIVAGGGGGGFATNAAGGGGAGGLLQGFAGVVPGASYFVTIGSGGTFSNTINVAGSLGGNSVFDATSSNATTGRIVATGGGGGGSGYGNTNGFPTSGGSGGGGWSIDNATLSLSGSVGASGISGQGNAGGNGFFATSGYGASGGGGGAGTLGLSGASQTAPGNGGAGIASDITGTRVTYAGGGGGGNDSRSGNTTPARGGAGGGGNGGAVTVATAATSNTGGGGGGGSAGSGNSTNGGSGIVVIRYPGNVQYFTGGTLNYSNGFIVHTFYSSGTLTPIAPRLFATPDYQIARSLRFNSADSAYLNRTPAVEGNRKTWTWSGWVKRSILGGNQALFARSDTGGGSHTGILFSSDCLRLFSNSGADYQVDITSTQVFRDSSAWYHIIVALDTTQATSTNRAKMYVNGFEITSFSSTPQYPAQNSTPQINTTNPHGLGRYLEYSGNWYLNGYITEVNFIDGYALTPASFGYNEPSTGVWTPLRFTGSYGTNGFYLNFADNSNTTAATLGKDSSGNSNNWTPNNFSVTAGVGNDSLVDSPTNYGVDTGAGGEVRGNYATLNPLPNTSGNAVLTNGNLDYSGTQGPTYALAGSTVGMSSGKWYWEVTIGTLGPNLGIGVFRLASPNYSTFISGTDGGIGFYNGTANTIYYWNGSSQVFTSYTLPACTTGDVVSIALDLDNGNIYYAKNGTWGASGNPATQTNPAFTGLTGTYAAGISVGGGGTSTATYNFGQRAFAYTAPSGFKALCSQNLPESGAGKLPSNYFGVATYTGNGSTNAVGPFGFQPDLAWTKSRSATGFNILRDSVRGSTKRLISDGTYDELDDATYGTFTYNGLSLGSNVNHNTSGTTYVAWAWNAGGTTVTNTTGSISAQVRANPTAGFSIVTFTGTGANGTVGHGLSVAPSMIIVRNRTTAGNSWCTWHTNLTNGAYALFLDATNAQGSFPTIWNSTIPTSTVFSVGTATGTNASANNLVAYCFAEVPGYSRFGSYVGNGAVDGPFVYTGFRPAFILTKDITTSSFWWEMVDSARSSYNPSNKTLYANVSDAEYTSYVYDKDLLSNGFKIRGINGGQNTSGSTYIYMAFAESPLKYTRAR